MSTPDDLFDEDLFHKGLERRKRTLGADYVENNLAAADDFTRPFQEAMTAWCWGFGWGDDAIDAKTRSMMNLAMLGVLGRLHEWETHCRGALNNGVDTAEIRAIVHVIGIYGGVPLALSVSGSRGASRGFSIRKTSVLSRHWHRTSTTRRRTARKVVP